MREGTTQVETGASRAYEAGQALAAILTAAEGVRHQVEEIAAAASYMGAASSELVGAMNIVSAVVDMNTADTAEMATESNDILQLIGNIASVSEETSASVQEVSASTQEMSAQVEDVTASAQSLREMAQGLLQLVGQFKLVTEAGSDKTIAANTEQIAPEPILSEYNVSYSGQEVLISTNGRH